MRRAIRVFMAITMSAFWAVGGMGPAAQAQGTDCPLLTVTEAETALGETGLKVSGAGSFCTFSGESSLIISAQPGVDLETQRANYADAVDTTIAGNPAISSEQGRTVAVGLPGQLLGLSYYGSTAWADALPMLTGLLELAIPRVPAGPSPEDLARMNALIPATVNGSPMKVQTLGGDLLLGFMDQAAVPVVALQEALAAQGKTASDVLFVAGETEATDDSYAVVAILIKGADANALIEPLFRAFASSSSSGQEATFTPVDIGGRSAVRIEGATEQGPLVALASGDIILAASVPDAELEAVITALP